MPDDYTPHLDRIDAELKATRRFRKKHPYLWPLVIVAAFVVLLFFVYDYLAGKEALAVANSNLQKLKDQYKEENDRLHKQMGEKDAKIGQLETRLSPFTSAAILKYGAATEENYRKLADDVQRMEKALAEEVKTIRSCSVTVGLTLTGLWTKGQIKSSRMLVNSDDFFVLRKSKESTESIISFRSENARCFEDAEGHFRIEYSASVPTGKFPLGRSVDELPKYFHCSYALALFAKHTVPTNSALLIKQEIDFFINGKRVSSLHRTPSYRVDVLDNPGNVPILELTLRGDSFLDQKN